MSISILEVLENAGFDVKNNIDDAYWLQNQKEEFEELVWNSEHLTDEWEDYKYWTEEEEEKYGEQVVLPDFETWRKMKDEEKL